MKKVLATVAAGILLCFGVLALAGCGGGSAASSSSSSEGPSSAASSSAASSAAATAAPENNTLIVGFDAEYPPYGFLADKGAEGYVADDGETYTGFDLDLANAVCERNGWTLQVKPIDWNSKDALLGSGDINCIWNGFTLEGRESQYAFTEPYMLNAQVIVVKADSDIATLADLAGKHVITQKDSAALDQLEGDQKALADTFAGGEVETIKDYQKAFMSLESGAADAVACDLSVAVHQMNANPDAYKMLDEQLSSEHYAVGFALGNDALAQTVTDTLKALDAEGAVTTIAEKYGDDIDYENNWCLGK